MSGPNQKKPDGKKQAKRSRKPEQLSREPDPPVISEPDQPAIQEPAQLHSEPPEPRELKVEPTQHQTPEPLQHEASEQMQREASEPLQHQASEPLPHQASEALQHQASGQMHDEIAEQPCNKEHVDAAVASDELPTIDFQTIATAYGNYTKRSFAETKAYVEKLSGVRSLDKIVEIQTEFAKQAYDTFVTESKKIRELYSGLAKQNLKPFESLVGRKNRGPH